MSGSSSQWDEPDPRVKWALDIIDPHPEVEHTTLLGYYGLPVVNTLVFGAMNPIYNLLRQRPRLSSLPITLGFTALGLGSGIWARDWNARKNAEQDRVAKHYIMTHPEKFIEPEKKKFGDACVVLPWKVAR